MKKQAKHPYNRQVKWAFGGLLVIAILATIWGGLWLNSYYASETEIRELIVQGYLDADYTREDINKLCNPRNANDRKAAKGAYLMWSCINNGAW